MSQEHFMVSGHNAEAQHWTVETYAPDFQDQQFEFVHADRVSFDSGGVLVFADGEIIDTAEGLCNQKRFVTAFAAGYWRTVWEQPNRNECYFCAKRDGRLQEA